MPPKPILNISSVEPFILDEGSDSNDNIYKSWLVWVEELDIYLLAAGVSDALKRKRYFYILVEGRYVIFIQL